MFLLSKKLKDIQGFFSKIFLFKDIAAALQRRELLRLQQSPTSFEAKKVEIDCTFISCAELARRAKIFSAKRRTRRCDWPLRRRRGCRHGDSSWNLTSAACSRCSWLFCGAAGTWGSICRPESPASRQRRRTGKN